jgi:hypothetical protein
MNGLTLVIPLQDKNTWTLVIFRIIFYHHFRYLNTGLIVSVLMVNKALEVIV